MRQQLLQRHRQLIFTPFKIRNQIINEDKLGRDIDNFHPKDQLRVLQSYMPMSEIRQRLIHQKELNAKRAKLYLEAFVNSHKSSRLNAGLNFHDIAMVARAAAGGFNKTGLKAYYKFNQFVPSATASFTESYDSNTGWTQTGTGIDVDSSVADKLAFASVANGADRRVEKATGVTLSDTSFIAQFTYRWETSGTNIPSHPIFYFIDIAGNIEGNTQDLLGILHTDTPAFQLLYKDGASTLSFGASSLATPSAGTDSTMLFERVSATLFKLSCLVNGVHTGTPITQAIASTIQSLDIMGSSTYSPGSASRTLNATINDLSVWSGSTLILENMATSVGSADSLGTAANGSLNGVIDLVSGKIGNAYKFNGSTGYSELGSSVSQFNFLHNATSLWTINFWMKKAAGTPAAIYTVLGVHQDLNTSAGLDLNISTNRRVVCFISNGSASVIDNTGAGLLTSNDTNWHMITCRWDYSLGSANFKAREDNGADTSNDKTGTTSATDAAAAYRIGNNRSTYYMNGSLDEMAIFNRILSDAEITSLYNSGNGFEIT